MSRRLKPRVSFLLFVILVLAQLVWLVVPAGSDGYRIKERAEAAAELQRAPSPATKAAFEEELRRWRQHRSQTLWRTIGLFSVVDGICIGLLWKDRRRGCQVPQG